MATLTYVPSRIGEGFFIDVPIPGSGDDDKALTYDHATGKFVYVAFDAAGTAAAAVAAHVAASDPHTQYELESANTAAAILTKLLTVDGVGSGLDADLLDGNSSAFYLPAASFVPAGSTTQVQYNSAGAFAGDAGLTYNAATDRLSVAGGLVAGDWSPPNDSTTALSVWNAARSSRVVTVDTTNQRVGFGTSPTRPMHTLGGLRIDATSMLYDNRDNAVIIQSASSVASNRDLSMGNATYLNALFSFKGIGFGSSITAADLSGISAFFAVKGGSSTGTAGFNAYISGQAGAAGNNNGGHIIIDAGAATGSGVNGSIRLGATVGYVAVGQSSPTALLDLAASTTARASLRIRAGTAPTTPNAGDCWFDGTNLKFYDGTTTRTITWT